ncbi:hypothetical protein KBA41_16670 [Candidatus Ozemobacteraceae bacterium]|nr:hypothetical protein [Candidatus Ozemobacteraceae bacterium]
MKRKLLRVLVAAVVFSGIGLAAFAAGEKITKAEWMKARTTSEQFLFDIKCWHSMLFPPVPPRETALARRQDCQRRLLGRLLCLVKFGGLKMRTTAVDTESADDGDVPGLANGWKEFPHVMASVFSHGGRTMIAIKKAARLDPYTVTNWIVTGNAQGGTKQVTEDKTELSGFKGRAFSTHLTDFKNGDPAETKCKVPNTQNWAMNIPMGGYGSMGADGKPVVPNGAFGHLLFVTDKAPSSNKDWTVATLVGVENSQAPMFTMSGSSKSHLGTSHSVAGASEVVGPTGGKKWPEMTDLPAEWRPGAYDCMRVVIESREQFDEIMKAASIIDDENAMLDLLSNPPTLAKNDQKGDKK